MGSTGVIIIIAIAIVAVVGAGIYLFWPLRNGAGGLAATGFFTPRERRLAFVERVSLEGGRKLVLVRRDDIEHLVMIGGPVDVVIETGIKVEEIRNSVANGNGLSSERWDDAWRRPEFVRAAATETAMPVEPKLSLSTSETPVDEPTLVLTPVLETKSAH